MQSDKSQRKRFEETARELECDEDEGRFNATLKKIVPAKTEKDGKPKSRSNKLMFIDKGLSVSGA